MENVKITEPKKECSICHNIDYCYELEDDIFYQIDFYGVESLTEIQQAIYEGKNICEECYFKEA